MNVEETAKYLGTNKNYVYRLRDSRLCKFIKIGTWKTKTEWVDEFLDKFEGHDITNPMAMVLNGGADGEL